MLYSGRGARHTLPLKLGQSGYRLAFLLAVCLVLVDHDSIVLVSFRAVIIRVALPRAGGIRTLEVRLLVIRCDRHTRGPSRRGRRDLGWGNGDGRRLGARGGLGREQGDVRGNSARSDISTRLGRGTDLGRGDAPVVLGLLEELALICRRRRQGAIVGMGGGRRGGAAPVSPLESLGGKLGGPSSRANASRERFRELALALRVRNLIFPLRHAFICSQCLLELHAQTRRVRCG